MGMPNLKKQILEQLDNDMIEPEKIGLRQRQKQYLKNTSVAELVGQAHHLKKANSKHDLLVRQKLIDAAEGRLIGVVEEFEEAFGVLEKYPKTVTIFGSARLPQDHPDSILAYEVAGRLAREGYAVVSGGGGGIMEAVNHGAYDNGGGTIGFNIKLPHEQKLNTYTTDHYTFEHFFARKVAMTLDASAYLYFTGGYGTLDELFEIITLEQTGRIPRAPIILVGEAFWKPIEKVIEETLDEKYHTIHPDDKKLYTITDDIDKIVRIVKKFQGEIRNHKEYSPHEYPTDK
jgi:uncharacterized protein (TIGR00730 family)